MNKAQISATIQVIKIIADVIKDLKQIPSGHLYARLMGKLSLSQYNSIINILKKSGKVSESHNLLTWND